MIPEQMFYGNPLQRWLIVAAVITTVFCAAAILKKAGLRRLARRTAATAGDWTDLLLSLAEHIHSFFLLALAIYIGAILLVLPDKAAHFIQKGFSTLFLLQLAIIGTHTIAFLIERYRRKKSEGNGAAATSMSSVGFVLKMFLWLILLLVALDNLGVNINTLIAGLGVSGIAVALAVQNLLGDLFASFSIVFDKPFVIGDFIVIDDFMGTVEHVGLKTTRLRSLSGEQLIFANSDLLQSRIRNYRRMHVRRIVFNIQVAYQTSGVQLNAIPGIVRDIIQSQAQTRFDRAHFSEYSMYGIAFEIVYWVQSPDIKIYRDIQQSINLALFERFAQEGIAFAYLSPGGWLWPDPSGKPG